jgi:hypothetical protein
MSLLLGLAFLPTFRRGSGNRFPSIFTEASRAAQSSASAPVSLASSRSRLDWAGSSGLEAGWRVMRAFYHYGLTIAAWGMGEK